MDTTSNLNTKTNTSMRGVNRTPAGLTREGELHFVAKVTRETEVFLMAKTCYLGKGHRAEWGPWRGVAPPICLKLFVNVHYITLVHANFMTMFG